MQSVTCRHRGILKKFAGVEEVICCSSQGSERRGFFQQTAMLHAE